MFDYWCPKSWCWPTWGCSADPFDKPNGHIWYDAIVMSLWCQNIMTSFSRHNDIVIALCVHWEELVCEIYFILLQHQQCSQQPHTLFSGTGFKQRKGVRFSQTLPTSMATSEGSLVNYCLQKSSHRTHFTNYLRAHKCKLLKIFFFMKNPIMLQFCTCTNGTMCKFMIWFYQKNKNYNKWLDLTDGWVIKSYVQL